MRRLLLLIAGILILTAVAVPSAAFYYFAFTEPGLQFLFGKIPHKAGNTGLEFLGVRGTLARGIHIDQVEIDHHLVHLTFKNINARIELTPLLFQTVRTKGASIESAAVEIKRRRIPPKPSTPFFLPRWLIVSAEHLRVGSATLAVYNGFHLEYSHLEASGIARYRQLRFYQLTGQSGHLNIEGTGELSAYDPLRIHFQNKLTWTPEDQPAWSVNTVSQGDLNRLEVTAHTLAPFRADYTGQFLTLTNQWHWQGRAMIHDLDVTAWGGNRILGLISGHVNMQGNGNGFRIHGPLNSAGLNAGLFDSEFEGAYSNHVLWAKHIGVTHRESGAHASAGGTIEVVKNGPRLNLRGTWQNFRWPLVGKVAPFHSSTGEYTLEGTWPYSVHATGMAQAKELPPMQTTIVGELAKDRFTFTQGDVDLYGGHATVSGETVWTPADRWAFSGHIVDVNPALLRSDLPGRLSFNFATQGERFDGNGDFSVDIHDISGRLRAVPASGSGKFVRTGSTWQFDKLRMALGGTNLAVDGHLNDTFDLRFAVSAKDLSLLSPDSRGTLEGNGTIRGTTREPIVAATVHASGIQHEGINISDLLADIDFNPSPQYESKVTARVRTLVYRDRTLDELNFKLNGRSSNYDVRLDAKALGMSLAAAANGPLNNGVWQGQMQSMQIIGTESLRLKLEHPVGLVVSADEVRGERMCMVGTPGSICADGAWNPRQWNATFNANQMPLSTFTAGMTRAVDYSGQINFVAHAAGVAGELPEGNIRADLTDAVLSHKLSSGRIDHAKIGSGFITLNANRNIVAGEVGLESGDVGTIQGTLVAQRSGDNWQAMPVQGELHAHTDQLGLVTLYVPDIDRAAGHLDGDMKIAGTLGTPLVDGTLKISEGEIDYYQVNMGLRQLAFDARLTDNGVDFKGSARIGSGIAHATGRLEWRNSLPYGTVNVDGSNLRVTDVPEAQIDASPNLQFNISGRKIDVTGSVKVPYAKIVPADLTGAVRSSSDEVVVGQEQTDPTKRFEVTSTISLGLEDKVSIDTSGLTGRLTGNVTVRSGYDEASTAQGELSIEQGKYSAYARKLDIQRGRLIFTGGPVTNPGLDIRAVKEFPDVIAGVNVRGTLLQPRMSFFSDPSLTQSQIASLILSGGSFESAQGRQSGSNEMLAQGGAILAQQLGSKVGIEDVSLESDLTNETSLVLGRYLSPRLYVSYGIALTEQLNVLKLRYSLGDRWTIKTEVGQARGADLVYTIQK
ncbi:MAG: translocation/assembly module TamB domain-containing protein [Proteobacteria bacterium]|nr:translocation/assembly module TamB domain-containing protein [Pseudomonadota bacterium]